MWLFTQNFFKNTVYSQRFQTFNPIYVDEVWSISPNVTRFMGNLKATALSVVKGGSTWRGGPLLRGALTVNLTLGLARRTEETSRSYFIAFSPQVQYDGSKDDLDWRIDFRYLNFIWFFKKFEIHANQRLLYYLNKLAFLILQLVTWLLQDFIFSTF